MHLCAFILHLYYGYYVCSANKLILLILVVFIKPNQNDVKLLLFSFLLQKFNDFHTKTLS